MDHFTCCYCLKNFVSKYNMTKHQKTTKKCLEIQENINNENNIFKCEFCTYNTRIKGNIDRHLISCKNRLDILLKSQESEKDKIIEKQKDEIKMIEDNYKKLEVELTTVKSNFELQKTIIFDLQQMVLKSRITTNNTTYVTNQQRIDYSKANLHPYDELKDNITSIIN